jgi:hypothetical protein
MLLLSSPPLIPRRIVRAEEIRFAIVRLLQQGVELCRTGDIKTVEKLMATGIDWCHKYMQTYGHLKLIELLSEDLQAVQTSVQGSIVRHENVSLVRCEWSVARVSLPQAAYSSLLALQHAHLNEYAPDSKAAFLHSLLSSM